MSSWLIKVDGIQFSSDDFLIEDVGSIEKASGTSWYIANPLVEVPVARAFLAAAMLRSGRPSDVVEKTLKEVDPSDPNPTTTTPSSSPSG